MKKFILSLIVVFLLIAGLKLFVSEHVDSCLNDGGVWYKDICLTSNTPENELKKAGLITEVKTEKTNIKVTYPYKVLEYPRIYKYLKKNVETIKKENGFEDQDIELGLSGHPWSLNIDMSNYASGDKVASILGYVFSFTGGAHPNHSYFSVNFDKTSQDKISITDLFGNTKTVLDKISKYAVSNILVQKSARLNKKIKDDEWLVEGAGPDLKNYNIFVFVPDGNSRIEGLKFIFPPYQVGPYVEGEYEVTVPSAIFYNNLRSQYKNNFVLKEAK